jgi:hypothetical protein
MRKGAFARIDASRPLSPGAGTQSAEPLA